MRLQKKKKKERNLKSIDISKKKYDVKSFYYTMLFLTFYESCPWKLPHITIRLKRILKLIKNKLHQSLLHQKTRFKNELKLH